MATTTNSSRTILVEDYLETIMLLRTMEVVGYLVLNLQVVVDYLEGTTPILLIPGVHLDRIIPLTIKVVDSLEQNQLGEVVYLAITILTPLRQEEVCSEITTTSNKIIQEVVVCLELSLLEVEGYLVTQEILLSLLPMEVDYLEQSLLLLLEEVCLEVTLIFRIQALLTLEVDYLVLSLQEEDYLEVIMQLLVHLTQVEVFLVITTLSKIQEVEVYSGQLSQLQQLEEVVSLELSQLEDYSEDQVPHNQPLEAGYLEVLTIPRLQVEVYSVTASSSNSSRYNHSSL